MPKSSRILIVDDDGDAADFARRFLSAEGYLVSWAGNGKEALRLMGRGRVDLVLLDVRMPGMDGGEVLSEILDSPRPPAVLIFTGDDGLDPKIREMAKRASGIVLKPFKLDDFRRRVRAALAKRASAPRAKAR